MSSQATDLGVQILDLALVGSLQVGQRIAALEHVRQALDGSLLPVTQNRGMNAILGRELAECFGFLQQFQDELGFERSGVRLFHTAILPNPGVLSVQILGSTIARLERGRVVDGWIWAASSFWKDGTIISLFVRYCDIV